MDEWEWTSLAYHARTESLTFALVFAPHNEHRNTLPNLVFLALDHFGGWNVARESAVSLAVLVASDLLLWRLIRRTIPGARRYFAFALVSCLLCSLGQWENIALGYNMGWNFCTFGLIAMVILLTSPTRTLRSVSLAAIIAAGATFSSGQGLLLWPCGLLAMLLVRRQSAVSIGVWSAAAGVVLVAFYYDYHPAALTVPPGAQPMSWPVFALAFLGASLRGGSGWSQAAACGALLVLLFAATCSSAIMARPTSMERHVDAPWLVLAAYALLGACVTASARRELGVDTALQSHYAGIALFLPLATIGLIVSGWSRMAKHGRRALIATIAPIMLLTLGTDVHGALALTRYAADRRSEIAALRATRAR